MFLCMNYELVFKLNHHDICWKMCLKCMSWTNTDVFFFSFELCSVPERNSQGWLENASLCYLSLQLSHQLLVIAPCSVLFDNPSVHTGSLALLKRSSHTISKILHTRSSCLAWLPRSLARIDVGLFPDAAASYWGERTQQGPINDRHLAAPCQLE